MYTHPHIYIFCVRTRPHIIVRQTPLFWYSFYSCWSRMRRIIGLFFISHPIRRQLNSPQKPLSERITKIAPGFETSPDLQYMPTSKVFVEILRVDIILLPFVGSSYQRFPSASNRICANAVINAEHFNEQAEVYLRWVTVRVRSLKTVWKSTYAKLIKESMRKRMLVISEINYFSWSVVVMDHYFIPGRVNCDWDFNILFHPRLGQLWP